MVEVARVSVPYDGPIMVGEVVADPERLLSGPEVAAVLGIRPDTWRAYVNRGQAPAPDVPGVGCAERRRPKWRLSTVRAYHQGKKRKAWKLPK